MPTTSSSTSPRGGTTTIGFTRAIIAAGSEAVKLPFMPKDDPRVVTSTGALELPVQPKRMLIVGGGIIGLEMGTVYSTLGARLDVVEMLDGLMLGADRDLVKVWQKLNAPRFDNILLKTKTVERRGAQRTASSSSSKARARSRSRSTTSCCRRSAACRTASASAPRPPASNVSERGFVPVDIQMRTNVPHIFAVGDIVGQPMLEHKAVHEAHVAAEVAAGEQLGDDKLAKTAFDARVIPSVAYTDPEIAWVGITEDEAKARGVKVKKGLFPWTASGRAIANGRDEGFTKLLFDEASHAHRRRRHRRHARRRHDRRDRAGDRDGRRRGRHRQDDPSAPDARRIDRPRRRGVRGRLHRPAAGQALTLPCRRRRRRAAQAAVRQPTA